MASYGPGRAPRRRHPRGSASAAGAALAAFLAPSGGTPRHRSSPSALRVSAPGRGKALPAMLLFRSRVADGHAVFEPRNATGVPDLAALRRSLRSMRAPRPDGCGRRWPRRQSERAICVGRRLRRRAGLDVSHQEWRGWPETQALACFGARPMLKGSCSTRLARGAAHKLRFPGKRTDAKCRCSAHYRGTPIAAVGDVAGRHGRRNSRLGVATDSDSRRPQCPLCGRVHVVTKSLRVACIKPRESTSSSPGICRMWW